MFELPMTTGFLLGLISGVVITFLIMRQRSRTMVNDYQNQIEVHQRDLSHLRQTNDNLNRDFETMNKKYTKAKEKINAQITNLDDDALAAHLRELL